MYNYAEKNTLQLWPFDLLVSTSTFFGSILDRLYGAPSVHMHHRLFAETAVGKFKLYMAVIAQGTIFAAGFNISVAKQNKTKLKKWNSVLARILFNSSNNGYYGLVLNEANSKLIQIPLTNIENIAGRSESMTRSTDDSLFTFRCSLSCHAR